MEELKIKELAELLEITEKEAKQKIEDEDYLILTDEEANEKAREYILDSLWAFNADFIIEHCKKLDFDYSKDLQKIQTEQCENCNGLIEALIDDIDEFVEDAINTDGRGHFISWYDGEEQETEHFFVYRMN